MNRKTHDIMTTLSQRKRKLEKMGYTVAFISLYGSQNYELDIDKPDYKSDIDTKAIVIPTLDDLINNSKPVSKVYDFELGQCEVKDIRHYFDIVMKGNPAYLEVLFTDYMVIDEECKEYVQKILIRREDIVYALRYQMLRAMYGMMKEKEKALTHPYPSIKHKIDKFGYDGKQLSHIYRLYIMMSEYFTDFNKKKALVPPKMNKEAMIKFKMNELTLEQAKAMTKEIMDSGKIIKDNLLEQSNEKNNDYSIKYEIKRLYQGIIKTKIVEDIAKNNKK